MKKLVIVESPSKSKTIEKYLGADYKVVSSKGHIRDLATSGKFGLGVDIENDFAPNYVPIKGKAKDINALKKVKIGDNVLIASKVFLTDLEHGSYKGDEYDSVPDSIVKDRDLSSHDVIIEDNVWIRAMVSILPGVTIGKNSIIGSNSVVTKSIPENCIAVGNPAKIVKKYNYDTQKWERIE